VNSYLWEGTDDPRGAGGSFPNAPDYPVKNVPGIILLDCNLGAFTSPLRPTPAAMYLILKKNPLVCQN
jgi:hypothetical protein